MWRRAMVRRYEKESWQKEFTESSWQTDLRGSLEKLVAKLFAQVLCENFDYVI